MEHLFFDNLDIDKLNPNFHNMKEPSLNFNIDSIEYLLKNKFIKKDEPGFDICFGMDLLFISSSLRNTFPSNSILRASYKYGRKSKPVLTGNFQKVSPRKTIKIKNQDIINGAVIGYKTNNILSQFNYMNGDKILLVPVTGISNAFKLYLDDSILKPAGIIGSIGVSFPEYNSQNKNNNPDTLAEYTSKVRILTNKTKIDNFLCIGNIEHSQDPEYHLDHKFSIKEGWLQNIKPECIASASNLEYITARQNLSKGANCSIEIDILLDNWKNE